MVDHPWSILFLYLFVNPLELSTLEIGGMHTRVEGILLLVLSFPLVNECNVVMQKIGIFVCTVYSVVCIVHGIVCLVHPVWCMGHNAMCHVVFLY